MMADENVGVNPPDFTTLAGNVRLLTGDTDPEPMTDESDTTHGQYAWYSDEELEALGELFHSSPKRVAIHVLSIVAVNQAMLLKKWTTDDLAVDGPAIIKGIEATLKRLSGEADKEDDVAGLDEYFALLEPTHPYPHHRYGTWEYGITILEG
jgi:hypothetical protein